MIKRIGLFILVFIAIYAPFYVLLGLSVPGGLLEVNLPLSLLLPFDLIRSCYQQLIQIIFQTFGIESYSYHTYVCLAGKEILSINNSCLGLNYFALNAAYLLVLLKTWNPIQLLAYELGFFVMNTLRFIILIILHLNKLPLHIIDHHVIFDACMLIVYILLFRYHYKNQALHPSLKLK